MASDRPLFDDEDLPDWLKKAGITYAGQQGQGPLASASPQPGVQPSSEPGWEPGPQPSSQSSAQSGDLPWLSGEADLGGATPPWEESAPAQPGGTPAWMQDLEPASSAPSGPGASPFAGFDEQQPTIDWEQPTESTPSAAVRPPGFGGTGELPWREGVSGPQDQQPPAGEPAASTEMPWERPATPQGVSGLASQPPEPPAAESADADDLSWLDEALEAQASAAPAQPSSPITPPAAPTPAMPRPAQPEVPRAEAPQPQVSRPETAQPAPAEQSPIKPIRRLPKTETGAVPQVPADAPRSPIKKLPPRPPDLSNMTYEEWEQSQIAKEQEAQSDPADKLLDEVPDWFQGPGAPPPSASSTDSKSGPEFMPDWFVGMEEQSPDNAPDWFKNVDLSGAPLVGPETVQTPPTPAPPPAASADADVPDWFKGAGVEGMDFNAMFGAQPESAPAQSAPVEPTMPVPPTPEPAALSQAEAMPGWTSDMPDLDALVGDLDAESAPVEPAPTPTPAAEPAMDWLREPAESTTAEPEALDWSALETGGSEEPTTPQQPEPASAAMSGWMADLAPAEAAEAKPVQPAAPQASGLPDWMRDMAPAEAEPGPTQPQAEPELGWLADIPASGPSTPAAPTMETPEPDWVETVEPAAAPFSTTEGLDLESPAGLDIDKLLNLAPETPSAGAMVPVDQEAQSLSRVDTDFDLDALLGPVPEAPQAEPPTIDLDALAAPEIGEAGPPRAGRLVRVPPTPQPTQETPKPREELPEWISEMRPSEAVALRIGDQEVRLEEKPQTRLTDQLRQLRDRAKALTRQPGEAGAPEAGPLAGISGAIEAIPLAVETTEPQTAAGVLVSDAQARRVKLIQKILAAEEEMLHQRAAAEDELAEGTAASRRVTRARLKVDRIVLTIVLALAVVAPFFIDALNVVAVPDLSQLTPTQASVSAAIDAIPPDQNVLVAFEYGPTGSGELDDLARVMLREIIRHKGRPVVVSTNPAGALHAESLLAVMGSNGDELALMNRAAPLVARQDYVVLRYLPGGAVGVRSLVNALTAGGLQQQVVFGTDLQGKASGLGEANLDNLRANPAFVLTENPEDVRNWIEQYQISWVGKPSPVVLLSSAGASAVAETYAHSAPDKHVLGPLVGLRDSMIYQSARQPSAKNQKLAVQRWQSIGLSLLLASVVVLLGAAVNLIRSLQRRERR